MMINIDVKVNDDIVNWMKKKNIKYSLTETGLDIEPKFEAIFKETWMFEHVVSVARNLRRSDPPSAIYTKLNKGSRGNRGQKFEGRAEVVDWCHENGMKFKFDYESWYARSYIMDSMPKRAKRVEAIRFTKEEHKALFLLTWG